MTDNVGHPMFDTSSLSRCLKRRTRSIDAPVDVANNLWEDIFKHMGTLSENGPWFLEKDLSLSVT